MKLRELLESTDKNTELYIGANSGYLFIGHPDDWQNANLSANEYHRLKDKFNKAKAEFEKAQNEFEQFVDFEDREVLETYISPAYANHCVVIEGNESGEFWMKKEAEIKDIAQKHAEELLMTFTKLSKDNSANFPEAEVSKAIFDELRALTNKKRVKGENDGNI